MWSRVKRSRGKIDRRNEAVAVWIDWLVGWQVVSGSQSVREDGEYCRPFFCEVIDPHNFFISAFSKALLQTLVIDSLPSANLPQKRHCVICQPR